jgi:predicted N-acetyltransferase YhbS
VEHPVAEALPAMQELASRTWTPEARHHPGQLAWSAAYALPQELDHGPVALWTAGTEVVAWAWREEPGWVEVCVDPARPELVDAVARWAVAEGPVATAVLETERHVVDGLLAAGWERAGESAWFTHHLLDLAALRPVPETPGYTFRAVRPGEAATRAACHRAAWSPTSKVSTRAYERLMRTPPYRADLDWVALDTAGEMVASCCTWLDATTGVALIEPVGCREDHRGRGLAGAVSLAALHAARDAGARLGLVCPRGDEGYPAPARLYRRLGFRPGPRTIGLRHPG